MGHIKILLTIFGIIFGLGAIIALISFIHFLWPPIREDEVKETVENHLQDKYQQEFVITDVSFQGQIPEYEIQAYPKKNKNQSFTITASEKAIEDPKKEITDGYLYVYWDHQLKQEFKGIAGDIFKGNIEKVTVSLSPGGYLPENEILPEYREIRMKTPDQFMHEFVLHLNQDFSENNQKNVEEKVFDLIETIREIKMKKVKLWVVFSNDYQYHLERGELDTVKNPSDLEEFLQHDEDPLIY